MPPTPKFTKGEILNTAFKLVKRSGYSALNARDLAKTLGTSTRPIFTAFENMEELKKEILLKACTLFEQYKENEISSKKYPPYKATGMAYIRFEKKKKNLFKLLFMRERSNDADDLNIVSIEKEIGMITKMFSVSNQKAEQFHVKLWIWVHGVATMIATSYLDWDFETISAMLTDVYNGLKDGVNK